MLAGLWDGVLSGYDCLLPVLGCLPACNLFLSARSSMHPTFLSLKTRSVRELAVCSAQRVATVILNT